jgi:hypothetical protein
VSGQLPVHRHCGHYLGVMSPLATTRPERITLGIESEELSMSIGGAGEDICVPIKAWADTPAGPFFCLWLFIR